MVKGEVGSGNLGVNMWAVNGEWGVGSGGSIKTKSMEAKLSAQSGIWRERE